MPSKDPNKMHWVIKCFDRNGVAVGGGYFDGTADKCRNHILSTYRKERPRPVSGAQVYYPADHYRISAIPNGMHFHFTEDAEYDTF